MGILSEEKAQELMEKIESGSVLSVDAPPSEPEVDVKVSGTEAPSGVEEKVEAAPAPVESPPEPVAAETSAGDSEGQTESTGPDGGPSDDSDLPGHRVPYKRFKDVLTARNKYRDESEEARAQAGAFKKQMESMRGEMSALRGLQPATPAEPAKSSGDEIDAELARLLGDSPQAGVAPQVAEQIKQLESRLYEQERQREYDRLQSEVSQVTGKYEAIPKLELQQVLLHAVSRDPTVSLVDVAEQYVTWKSGIEEAAIAKYLEVNPGATAKEAVEATESKSSGVPPRPARTGTGAARVAAAKSNKVGTIKEGTDALMRAIKSGSVNLFGQ